MSAEDNDGDSQMLSSPSDSDSQTQSTILEPQARSSSTSMPTSAAGANANGKRPINIISNGGDDNEESSTTTTLPPATSALKPRPDFPTRTHERSGYTWNREEDAPGYAWLNKKALDEYHRAYDSLVHKESMIKGRYGDPFEMADREQAMLNSLKQK